MNNNNNAYHYSLFGPLIEDLIRLRLSLGYKSGDYMSHLNDFDRYAETCQTDAIRITRDMAEGFCCKRPNESDKTRYNRISVYNRFALYLKQLGYESCMMALPRIENNFTPYIFSREQISRIFQVTDQLRDDKHHPQSALFCMPVLLRTLYATGIRMGEALNLTLDDVNLEDNYLILRGCKNGEDRMIPFSNSLSCVCREYLSRWNVIPANRDNRRFFIGYRGYPVCQSVSYKWFRKILFLADIPHGGRGQGPRLHDLRHTYSVHALAALGEKGIDLYYALPVLSTYLGHKSLSSTEKYVRLTSDMYPSLIKNMNLAFPFMYPEINENWSHETTTD